jgi:hypothetical protein
MLTLNINVSLKYDLEFSKDRDYSKIIKLYGQLWKTESSFMRKLYFFPELLKLLHKVTISTFAGLNLRKIRSNTP